MKAAAIAANARRRLANPVYWGMLLLIGGVWTLLSFVMGFGMPPLEVALSPVYWGILIIVIFPASWQWSGDDSPHAPFAQGLEQSLVWQVAWIMAIRGLVKGMQMAGLLSVPALHGIDPTARARGFFIHGFIVLCCGLLVGWLIARQEGAEVAEQRALEAAEQARIHVLQSQMNPHVLFNVISGLCELARPTAPLVERALLDLSGFLRELLDYSGLDRAPLSRERLLVERYLRLEQIRLGERLLCTWDWDPALEDLELPPLLLQPLVENAIKHGIAPRRGGGELRIRLSGLPGNLELEVANTGRELEPGSTEGVGLRNTRERLMHFRRDSLLSLHREGEWTRAVITLRGLP
nr:histidine kinase [uncultured Holophaga sp.]